MNQNQAPGTGVFRCLYDNDTTNVRCLIKDGPNDERGCHFTADLITASIDETVGTGVDVHKLSPGHSWVAWWKSASAPPKDEYRWMEKQFGVPPDGYGRYMLNDGDMVATFVKHCRQVGQAPFLSMRLNHAQGKDFPRFTPETLRQVNCCRWLYEHPEFLLNEPGRPTSEQRCLNWMIPEVRRRFLVFADELCAYDIDGFELDFMRYPCLFRQDQTTVDQRVDIITDFVRRVRAVLDRHARPGQRRRLCIKAPCHLAPYPMIGLDLDRLAAAGMDMLNLSPTFFTQQQTDLPEIRRRLPLEVDVYLEMADLIDKVYRDKTAVGRLTGDEMFFTAAHLAYSRGAQGVSLFNFVYYRTSANRRPPFHVLGHLHDRRWLARQPQHWFLCRGYGGYEPGQGLGKMMPGARSRPASPFPFLLEPGQRVCCLLDMAPPDGGWQQAGRCRLQARAPLAGTKLGLRLNGTALEPAPGVGEPFENPCQYREPSPLGSPDDYRAWAVPAGLLKDGENRFEVAMTEGQPVELCYLDVAIK